MRPKASQVAFRAQSLFWGSICSNYRRQKDGQRRLISHRRLYVEDERFVSIIIWQSSPPISTRQRAVHVKHHVVLSYQIRVTRRLFSHPKTNTISGRNFRRRGVLCSSLVYKLIIFLKRETIVAQVRTKAASNRQCRRRQEADDNELQVHNSSTQMLASYDSDSVSSKVTIVVRHLHINISM